MPMIRKRRRWRSDAKLGRRNVHKRSGGFGNDASGARRVLDKGSTREFANGEVSMHGGG